jgi:hypothetical protein
MVLSGLARTAVAKPAVGGKAGPRQVSTADSLAELTSRVILCEQTIIPDNLHHLFNALAHVGVAVQQLHH